MPIALARSTDPLAHLYDPPVGLPELVEVPEMTFLMADGRGDPSTSPAYRAAMEALCSLSYGIRFALRRSGRTDWRVHPLEGLWWVESEPRPPLDDEAIWMRDRSGWRWTAMIRQPDEVTPELVAEVTAAVRARHPAAVTSQPRLRRFREGLAAQVMHVGPYAAELPTIRRLHAFIAEHGCVPVARHHEIYLGDPRRSAPERLRTVIRQPVSLEARPRG